MGNKQIKCKNSHSSSQHFTNSHIVIHSGGQEEVTVQYRTRGNTEDELSNIFRSMPMYTDAPQWVRGDVAGVGAYGVVYQAFDHETGAFIAVKEIPVVDVCQAKTVAREVTALRKLRHPNIVRYSGCNYSEGVLKISMEYCPGGNIAGLVKRYGPFKEDVIRKYTTQIVAGLEYLHKMGLVHRDVKGANILLTQSGVVKLADFGCARTDGDEQKSSFAGTVNWMAPEVAVQELVATPAADVWSLGCCIIEMLTGKPPYADTNVIKVLHAMKKDDPIIPETVSNDLRDFLSKCFCRAPEERATCKQLSQHPFLNHTPSGVDKHVNKKPSTPRVSGEKAEANRVIDLQTKQKKLVFTYKKG